MVTAGVSHSARRRLPVCLASVKTVETMVWQTPPHCHGLCSAARTLILEYRTQASNFVLYMYTLHKLNARSLQSYLTNQILDANSEAGLNRSD